MYATASFVLFTCLVLAQTGPAPKVTNNQPGTWYAANLTSGAGNLTGQIGIEADVSGSGVAVTYDFSGFNLTDSLEFSYHIHAKPVPADGDCIGTGGHLDPDAVGDEHVCNPSQPETCQLGDLSGKHGVIKFNGTSSNIGTSGAYHDDFLSTTVGDAAYFGNLSVVVHRKVDKFRLACGNFSLQGNAQNITTSAALTTSTAGADDNATTSTQVVATSTVSDEPATTTSTATSGETPSTPGASVSVLAGGSVRSSGGQCVLALVMGITITASLL